MDSSRQQIGSECRDTNIISRRNVLHTTVALGFGTLVGTGQSRAQSDQRIEYGDTVSGTTDGEWTFAASVGDEISIDMRPNDPVNNSADIDLLDPSGDVVESATANGEDGNAVITRYEIERKQDGEYTIVASGDESFGYELSLYQGVPIDETIQYGATVESELTRDNRYFAYATFSGYHETYAFAASVGDQVSIEVRPDDPVTEEAEIELLDPDGDPVEGVGPSGEDGNAALTRYEIERGQGGQYTIVVSGADQTDLFGYELSLYEGVPVDQTIEYGETIESELTRDNRYFRYATFSGYHETYAFEASAGDEVSIELRPDDPVNEEAEIELLDPDGDPVEGVGPSGEDGNAALTRYDIERGQGGQYTIVASGADQTDLFGYEISLYEGVPIDETIEYGATVESEFTRDNRYFRYATFSGYHETYAFAASAGDEVSIELRPDSPDMEAHIRLLDSAGDPVEGVRPTTENGNAVITEEEVDQDGQYIIVASGDDQTDLFEYTLELRLDNRSEQTTTSVETASETETTVEAETTDQTDTMTPTETTVGAETTVQTDTMTATETTSQTATSTPTTTQSETSPTAETTSSSGPGFTAGSTVTALCSIGYALKRTLGAEKDEQ